MGETPSGSPAGAGEVRSFSLFFLFFFSPPFYSSPEATQQRVTGIRPPAGQDPVSTGRVCMRRAPSLPPPPASRPPDHSIPGELCTAVPARGIAAALPIRQGLSNHLPLPPSPLRSLYFIFTCSLLTRLFLNPARIYFSLSLSFFLSYFPFFSFYFFSGGVSGGREVNVCSSLRERSHQPTQLRHCCIHPFIFMVTNSLSR